MESGNVNNFFSFRKLKSLRIALLFHIKFHVVRILFLRFYLVFLLDLRLQSSSALKNFMARLFIYFYSFFVFGLKRFLCLNRFELNLFLYFRIFMHGKNCFCWFSILVGICIKFNQISCAAETPHTLRQKKNECAFNPIKFCANGPSKV